MAEAPTPTLNLDGLRTRTSSESSQREASEVPSINSVPQTATTVVASVEAFTLLQDPLEKVQHCESSTHIGSSTENHHSSADQGPQERQGSNIEKPVSLTDISKTDQYSSFPEEEQQSQQLAPEGHASSLQPSTPPLSSPAGASPTSRPASVTEGEDSSSTGPSEYPPLAEVAEGIREAIESRLRVSEVRRHTPEAMEESLPALRVVAAEIETPGQSPRGDFASPSSSGDSFGKALMHQAMRLKTAMLNQKVNFLDIARNPGLAKAAKAELDGESRSGATHLDPNPFPREADVERQRAALAAIDLEAEEESGINRELAAVMCTRLDAARRATEKLLGVLQACAGAEAAYTRALSAASKVRLVGGCDGASLHAALDGFSDLPFMVGQAHVRVGAGLSDTTKGMQDVVAAVRQACADISAESAKVHRAIDAARRHLQNAFADHTAACRLTDESTLARARGRLGRPFAEAADPWLTEARTVAAHGALQRAQAAEREFLTRAFAKVKALELQRTAAIKDVIAAFVVAYRTDLGAVKADTAPLLRVAEQIDGEADLAELTASSAAAAETGAALGARQAEALEATSQELLCSPEIIRQGEMARWVSGSGKWTDCHFVLTRCGFLHWFNNSPPAPADIVPADSLNLSRCQFETGEAPEFNLVEMAPGMFGRSRRLIFRASNVEECCEWAISLREAIRGE